MRINYNVSSIIARNALNNNERRVSVSTQKLSSGYKINSAADDAAGMAIARKMNAQIKSIQRANRNSNDGLSVVNTADGAMAEMHDILQRMNELSIQAANGTNANSDREQIQKEIDQLVNELDRIADTTQFNAQNLLDGSFAYKGYTNTENVKIMSYTEGVSTGTYVIGQIKYNHYEDKVTKYTHEEREIKDLDGKVIDIEYKREDGEITHDDHYEASSADDVQNALVTSTSLNQYAGINGVTAFPDGSKVILDGENIIVKAENDFELKFTINDKDALDGTGATTTSTSKWITTNCYKNITVTTTSTISNKRFNISELHIPNDTSPAYTNFKDDNGKGLREDFAELFKELHPDCDIEINGVTCDADTGTFEVDYTWKNIKDGTTKKETLKFELYQEKNEYGNDMKTQKTMENYLYSKTETKVTEYTVGGSDPSDCITMDLTGMGPMIVQVGANAGQHMEIEIPALNTINLGVKDLNITTEDSATAAIDTVGDAINMLSSVRSKIGAYANRLEHTITNLDTTEENMTASYSRIMDVDMATEMTEYSTVQVLAQASTSMLAQANERPQQVLQLLQ